MAVSVYLLVDFRGVSLMGGGWFLPPQREKAGLDAETRN